MSIQARTSALNCRIQRGRSGLRPALTDTPCDHLHMDHRPPGHSPAEADGRHRGQGHRPIKPPGFWSEFKRNPRDLSFVVCAGLFAIGWGTETALSGAADAPTRLAGVASATGGMLIWLSYILYFRPGSLALPAWQKVPARRRAVFVIRHLWIGAFTIAAAVWLAHWIATR
jgi:hypothetical protein